MKMTNPFDVIIDMSISYFDSHPDSSVFEIPKGLLSKKIEYGLTKTESLCNSLPFDYPFIKNGRGKIIIERKEFDAWLNLQNEKQDLKMSIEELNAKYPNLIKEIEELKQSKQQYERMIKELDEKRLELVKIYHKYDLEIPNNLLTQINNLIEEAESENEEHEQTAYYEKPDQRETKWENF